MPRYTAEHGDRLILSLALFLRDGDDEQYVLANILVRMLDGNRTLQLGRSQGGYIVHEDGRVGNLSARIARSGGIGPND